MAGLNLLDHLPPMHPEGRKFLIGAAVVTAIAFIWWGQPLSWIFLGLTLWVYAFFRDPPRAVPQGDDLVLSPADGQICQIRDVIPPKELDLGEQPRTRVSIFMSVFDCHVNRAPMAGTIRALAYVPGKFVNADLDKASEDNERQLYTLRTSSGVDIGFVQIAGLVARRIVRFVPLDSQVVAGERVGLIRFGSRVDVYLPQGTAPQVALGQRTVAGETVLARLGDDSARIAILR